jgi:hypothetical protein
MNIKDIRDLRKAGNPPWEILAMAVDIEGMEFPDASFRIKLALDMDHDEVVEMERDYDECC